MNELQAKLTEVEKRVRGLVTENAGLKEQVRNLEQELAQARREALDKEHVHGKTIHIKEKLERILNALEAATSRE